MELPAGTRCNNSELYFWAPCALFATCINLPADQRPLFTIYILPFCGRAFELPVHFLLHVSFSCRPTASLYNIFLPIYGRAFELPVHFYSMYRFPADQRPLFKIYSYRFTAELLSSLCTSLLHVSFSCRPTAIKVSPVHLTIYTCRRT